MNSALHTSALTSLPLLARGKVRAERVDEPGRHVAAAGHDAAAALAARVGRL